MCAYILNLLSCGFNIYSLCFPADLPGNTKFVINDADNGSEIAVVDLDQSFLLTGSSLLVGCTQPM